MKKLLLALSIILAVVFTNCSKVEDELTTSTKSGMELKKSENPIPFKGTLEGFITTVPSTCGDEWIGRHFEGDGNVTHMGRSHAVMDYCLMQVDFPSPGPDYDCIFKGPGTLVGANGDQIEGYFVGKVYYIFAEGSMVPIGGHLEAEAVLFGGTGIFQGAHGIIHGTGEMDFTTGANIATKFDFAGTIHYGSEFFEGTLTGSQAATGSCGPGSNAYLFTGDYVGTLPSPATSELAVCATTEFLPPPYPPIPIGGNSVGQGFIIDGNNDELYSTASSFYRFHYPLGPVNSTYMINYGLGTGIINGGTGVYEGATGNYLLFAEQTINLGPEGAIFPAESTYYVIGWVNYD